MAPKRGREETVDAIAATNEISPEPAPVRSSRESKKCNECRRRHVKCDEARPRCSNCVKSNAECSYSHRGMRYDHISDRQKRNDMYTEIKDISERVENLLAEYRPESAADDVTRLAIEYGWKVTVAPDGQKRILTNIETTSQLAALIPRAIEDVYGSDPSTPPNSLPEANGNNDSNRPSMDIPVRINIPDYVDRLVGTPSTTTAYMQCPCLFTFVLSPHMMNNMSPNVDFDNIKTAICSDPLLFSCIHTPEGFFQHLPPITGLKMENVLVQDSRLTRCSYANIFWNLLKTARLIDQEQYSQAYVNHGLTISKAFTLQLHKETGLAAVNGFLAREIVKRLFWAIWLFDVQLSLFLNIPSTIDLSDIEIDRPSTCEKMTQEDLDHSRFLQLLIDVRWLRVKMDVLVEESKLLNIVTQNIRELRRFHDKLDTNLRIEATVRSTEQSGWQRRTAIIILLDLASCFLAVFCKHLGRTDMVGLLALSMCRQAADIAILLLEKWISERFDCQYRLYLPLIIHSIAVHKHICQRKDVPIQYKWKAYATLQYLLRLFNATPDFFQLRIGQALFGHVSLALKQLEHIAQTDMSLIEDPDAIKYFSRYFSDWRPSMDTLPLHEHTFIFASESSTMYTIVEMKKAGN